MIGASFNDAWSFRPRVGLFEAMQGPVPDFLPVTLPHDAMLSSGRDPLGDPAVAYFRGGAFEYQKRFVASPDWRDRHVSLQFEGVYRDAVVFLNGAYLANRPYGYSELIVRLDDGLHYGKENVLRVECRTGTDSRWYTGAGIYRDVSLFVGDPIHTAVNGLRVTTPQIDDDVAVVIVSATTCNDLRHRATVQVLTELSDPFGTIVATDTQPLTIDAHDVSHMRSQLIVDRPVRWSIDDPKQYHCVVRIVRDDTPIDQTSTLFGIRSVTLDATRGLRINGIPEKLRGACVHHDNGILGAATIARAEERRIERLKAAGFNAIRSAHHPMSRALLDACDRIGMVVIDEAFDSWFVAKRDHDYALSFASWWESDVDAMIDKDFNHPSVVLYSIGNEVVETADPAGALQGRAMVDRIRANDPTRLVTNGVNHLLNEVVDTIEAGVPFNTTLGIDRSLGGATTDALDPVAARTAESFAILDVAGYNYAAERYESDQRHFPNRVIVGSETFPSTIDRTWRFVLDNPRIIGDFTWTGWDYLGEVGIGRIEYDTDPDTSGDDFAGPYPWRYAACGDIDATGHRQPISYYREIVFGLRTDPYVAVRPPRHHGARKRFGGLWAWTTAVESWTWPDSESQPITVEVYAAAPEVELLQNGTSLGRQPAGEAHRFRATYDTIYEPGELIAVAYDGVEIGRSRLQSATAVVQLRVTADRTRVAADHRDLAFVTVELVDADGTVNPSADRQIEAHVEGSGVLQGLGSARPVSDEPFLSNRCTTYRGRAIAAIRPTGAGTITVTVHTSGCPSQSITCHAA